MKPDRNQPITLEDLMRLKRAERPPAEFWAQFDRELRAKQLAALVQKHPWWQTFPAASVRALVRFRLPLGAAAVLAATLVSMRQDQTPIPASLPSSVPGTSAVAAAPITTAVVESGGIAAAIEPAHVVVTAPAVASVEAPAASVVVAAAETPVHIPPVSTHESTSLPLFTGAENGAPELEFSGSPLLAVSLGTAGSSGMPAGPQLVGATSGFESRVLPSRGTVDPLQQMSSPGETRRARLLTAMVSMASMEASARTTERAASRIAEEDLYDQVQRFGARGDRLHVKF